MEKKIYLYEVEVIIDGEVSSPLFTDSVQKALDAIRTLKSAGLECNLYRREERIERSYEI
jgi:hypothetical protein